MQEWSKKNFLNSDNEEAWSIVKKVQHSVGSRKDCVWEGKPTLKCLPAQGKQCRRMKGPTAQLAKTAWGTDVFHQTNFERDGDGGEALKHDAINHLMSVGGVIAVSAALCLYWELANYFNQFHNSSKPLLSTGLQSLSATPKKALKVKVFSKLMWWQNLNWSVNETIYNYLLYLMCIHTNF